MGDDANGSTPSAEATLEGAALARRVERGELSRDALELLAAVGHAPSRRALGRLDLVLTAARVPPRLDELPSGRGDGWLRWGARFDAFERSVAVETAHAFGRRVCPALGGPAPAPSRLVGLHTGPAGAIVLCEEHAARLFPLARTAARVLDAVARWLDEPTDPNRARVDAAWPALLRDRAKVAFLCELAGVRWEPVWVLRWVVATVCGPEAEVGAAVGTAAAWTHEALGDAAAVRRAARDVLHGSLIHDG